MASVVASCVSGLPDVAMQRKYHANSGSTTFGWQRSALEQFQSLQAYRLTDYCNPLVRAQIVSYKDERFRNNCRIIGEQN